ncbi:MAG: hypothetical protein OEZ43_09915 [Gammaproteobacteria bacterium]|nr:hypothetical protein [Gammaproteobacteria bacterium]
MDLKKSTNHVKVVRQLIHSDIPLLVPLFNSCGELLANKGVILDSKQVIKVLQHGDIYTNKDDYVAAMGSGFAEVHSNNKNSSVPHIFERMEQLESQLYSAFRVESGAFVQRIERVRSQLLQVVSISSTAVIAYIVMNQQRDVISHDLCCAALCCLLGEQLEWKKSERDSLVSAALTMDISLVSEHEDSEQLVIDDRYNRHPLMSRGVLSGLGVTDDKWLDYVCGHHGDDVQERDTQEKLPWGCHILSLADIFCSQLVGLYENQVMNAHDILGSLDKTLVNPKARLTMDALLTITGWYPFGSVVLLENDEVGVVTAHGDTSTTPIVKVIFAQDGSEWRTPVSRKTSVSTYAIKSVIPIENFRDVIINKQIWH